MASQRHQDAVSSMVIKLSWGMISVQVMSLSITSYAKKVYKVTRNSNCLRLVLIIINIDLRYNAHQVNNCEPFSNFIFKVYSVIRLNHDKWYLTRSPSSTSLTTTVLLQPLFSKSEIKVDSKIKGEYSLWRNKKNSGKGADFTASGWILNHLYFRIILYLSLCSRFREYFGYWILDFTVMKVL